MSEAKAKRLGEKDKLSLHYRAAKKEDMARIREALPAAAAFADWLRGNPGADERADALHVIGEALIAVDGIADPLPDEPDSTWIAVRRLSSTRPVAAGRSEEGASVIELNIKIADPADVGKLPAIFAALGALSGAATAPVALAVGSDAGGVRLVGENGPEVEETRRRRGRPAKAEQAETPPAAKTETPAEPGAEDFVVFNPDGSRRAGYRYATDAAQVMIHDLGKLTTVADVDAFLEANAATRAQFDQDLLQTVLAEAGRQRDRLAPKADPVDELLGGTAQAQRTYTPEEVLTALQAFAKSKGPIALADLLGKFGAKRFAELKVEHYAAVVAEAGA
ncbi:hypothetical protein [Arenibaculum pallidiluteum]|uniref:hypothetical protein n=1 Tax=Arenibaculum pallidiluteum TaxID=2812559 RepID=UPI001A96A333|nr:hypothetical protein [Arenibaculum pallidiluteum]